jgi:hypothetical protein
MCEQKLCQLEDSYQRERNAWMSRNSVFESSIRESQEKEYISNRAIAQLQKEQSATLNESSKDLAESKSLNAELRGENERLMEELATMEAQCSAFESTGTKSLAYEMFGSGRPVENNGGKVLFDNGTSGLPNSRLLPAAREFNCANVQTDSPPVGRVGSSEEEGELRPIPKAFTTSSAQTDTLPVDGAVCVEKGGELHPVPRLFTTSTAQTDSPVVGVVSSEEGGKLYPILRAFTTSSAQIDPLYNGEAVASGGRADVQTGPPISTGDQAPAPSTHAPRIQWYTELPIRLDWFKSIDTSLSDIHGYIEKGRRMAGIVHDVATEWAALSFGVIALVSLVLAPIIVAWRLLRMIFG